MSLEGDPAGPGQYARVGLPPFVPGPDAVAELEDAVRNWVFSAPLGDLIGWHGGRRPAGLTVRDALSWLDAFSAENWNFRQGKERWDIGAVDTPSDPAAIMAAVEALGLVGETVPRRRAYDRLLLLGGGAPACLLRPHYAATLLATGLLVERVAALGGSRALRPAEADFLQERHGAGCQTEGQALELGVRQALGRSADVVVTPPAGPGRANTADTYESWRAADPARISTILVITSEIYVPFQHCDAVRKLGLPLGCAVETVGVPAAHALPDGYRETFGAARYLQEVRSAVRSMRRLLAAIDGDTELAESR